MNNQNQSAAIVFLLPVILFILALGISVKVINFIWGKLNENREFRDTILQLQTTCGNHIEELKDRLIHVF